MGEQLYTISQASDKLGTTVKIVRRLVASGKIESLKKNGVLRVPAASLEAFSAIGSSLKTEKLDRLRVEREVNWVDISDVWQSPVDSGVLFVDLFCGAGGLSKGLEMAGLEGICGLDWFEEAGETYKRNFTHPFVNGDIRLQEKKDEFYNTVKIRLNGRKLNVVAGGFPCQGFSMAGNRIEDDPRNSLYKEMLEIVRNLQPEFVICENVKGLRSMLGGRVEQKIIDDYADINHKPEMQRRLLALE